VSDPFRELERIVLADPGRRGVAALARPGDLEGACRTLADASRVGVVTGFYIPSAGACETDGPLGAAHLARALGAGASTTVCTDGWCVPGVRGLAPEATDDAALLDGCDVLVSIERLGRATDERYYSMRGVDLTEWTAPLDERFLVRRDGATTVGVGDGGNEIGMGRVRERVCESIPFGDRIGSVVATDRLIVAGVSNWGAWALAAGMGLLRGVPSLPTPAEAFDDLKALVAAGAVDGVTGRREPTVDGLPWPVHAEILERLRSI
jgi:hypothetical protein